MGLTLRSWQVHFGAVLARPCQRTSLPIRAKAFSSSFTRKKCPERPQRRRRRSPDSRLSGRQYRGPLDLNTRLEPLQSLIRLSPEVNWALNNRQPVVALETTIYTHGFPYPDNTKLALDLEAIVRRHGAVPATIGILDGVARVGMSPDEIIALTSAAGKPETMKVSRRDLPYILGMGVAGNKLHGGTTVSGTIVLARYVGIKVFGTGGLGGVHRGGQDTLDISADLTELGRTPIAVVSSGCKSFLDIPRTLEYLETQGATVCTFADGRTGNIDFPSFYTRDSGSRSPMVVQNPTEAAAMIRVQERISSRPGSGLLFANPIPEAFAMDKAEIDVAIDLAVREAAEQGFHGHSNTPFILARIKELTKGSSIPANRALIESNVAMAAKVAVELAKLRLLDAQQSKSDFEIAPKAGAFMPANLTKAPEDQKGPPADIVVIGSVAIDLACDYNPTKQTQSSSITDPSPQMHTSNIATITPSIGGVGHNVALAAQYASGSQVLLCSLVSKDLAGDSVLSAMKAENLDTSGIIVGPTEVTLEGITQPLRTAQYVSVNDTNKDLVLAMADMTIFEHGVRGTLGADLPQRAPKWTVVDTNWSHATLRSMIQKARESGSEVAVEPVSVPKAARIFTPAPAGYYSTPKGIAFQRSKVFPNNHIDLVTPNEHELAAMHAAAKQHEFFETDIWWQIIDALGIPSYGARDRFVSITNHKMTDAGIPIQTIQLLPYIPTILTKLGADGVLHTELLKPNDPRLTDPASAPYILSRCTNGSTEVGGVYMRLFPAVKVVNNAVSVNGVGDTFLGVLIAGLAKGLELDEDLINIAQTGAVMTLRSKEAVSPDVKLLSRRLNMVNNRKLNENLLDAAGF